MKDKLGGKVITKFVGLREITYSYLINDGSEDNKGKGTKQCIIKRKLEVENYKNCLEASQHDNKVNYFEKNKIDIESFFCYKRKYKRIHKKLLTTSIKLF